VPPIDVNKLWYKVIAALENDGFKIFSLNCETASVDIEDEKFVITLPDKGSYNLFLEKNNIEEMKKVFNSIDELSKYEIDIREKYKLDENKYVSYLKDMFGSKIDIK